MAGNFMWRLEKAGLEIEIRVQAASPPLYTGPVQEEKNLQEEEISLRERSEHVKSEVSHISIRLQSRRLQDVAHVQVMWAYLRVQCFLLFYLNYISWI